MDLSTFLVHFGYEVGLLKQRNIEFATLNHDDDSIWLTPGGEINISEITDFGFFARQLIDTATQIYRNLPHDFKLFYLDLNLLQVVRSTPQEPTPDLVTLVIYRGLPHPIQISTPDGNPHAMGTEDLKIHSDHIPLIDALLGYHRLMPSHFSNQYPFGIPCRIKKHEQSDQGSKS